MNNGIQKSNCYLADYTFGRYNTPSDTSHLNSIPTETYWVHQYVQKLYYKYEYKRYLLAAWWRWRVGPVQLVSFARGFKRICLKNTKLPREGYSCCFLAFCHPIVLKPLPPKVTEVVQSRCQLSGFNTAFSVFTRIRTIIKLISKFSTCCNITLSASFHFFIIPCALIYT